MRQIEENDLAVTLAKQVEDLKALLEKNAPTDPPEENPPPEEDTVDE